jgi:hypothetical protein
MKRVRLTISMTLAVAVGAACGEQRGLPVEPSITDPTTELGGSPPLYGLSGHPERLSRACRGGRYRDFDFWIGRWDVVDPDGAQVGTNRVRPLLDGCLVEENWTASDGSRGRSMNAFDAATGEWSQYWIDQFGLHLRLFGGRDGAVMRLQGGRIGIRPDGSRVALLDRIRWTPLPGGDVGQFWDLSLDSGATFPIVVFDGRYVRNPRFEPAPPSPSGACVDSPYRELDYWVGDWAVATERGRLIGHSRVRSDLDGCLVEEDFVGLGGYRSQSFLGWDFRTQAWYRVLVDDHGVHLLLTGGTQDGVMTLRGESGRGLRRRPIALSLAPDGSDRVIQRIVAEPDTVAAGQRGLTLVYVRK